MTTQFKSAPYKSKKLLEMFHGTSKATSLQLFMKMSQQEEVSMLNMLLSFTKS